MTKRIWILFLLSCLFMGCEEDAFRISVRYDKIEGLMPGNRIILDQSEIGEVAGISYEAEEHFLAHLTIKSEFSSAVTEYSRFFIVSDPKDSEKKAVEMIHIRKGGTPLKNGSTVSGSTRSSALMEKRSASLESGLDDLKQGFDDFVEDLKKVPESEEFQKLEEELGRLTEEMKRSGKAAQEKIQKEWLPKLQEELERLRERLEEFGREEELEPLETQMKEIREI